MTTAIEQAGPSVAVVEDDPDIRALIQSVVTDGCAFYEDGTKALDALTSPGPLPAVVLLDLDLPGMHGFEVLKRLRAAPRTQHLPIVIFTATDSDPDEGLRLGANAWVRKPNEAEAMAEAVEAIIGFWTRLNMTASTPA